MSRRPASGKPHQHSSEVSDDVDPDDELRSTGNPQATSSQEIRCVSSLSELGQKFARINYGDYKSCETFIRQHPQILEEDARDFLKATEAALRAREMQLAKRCVQQSLLIHYLQDMNDREREKYLCRLMNSRHVDSGFVTECNEVLRKVEGIVISDLRTRRHETSSRLSPLGHVFVRIPVNQSAQCREFLKRKPEILDEDHKLYILEALSALRGGNDSEAQSAIEKSIILRDFDRRYPEEVFQGLSQSVSSAMTILKERAKRERIDDVPGRTQTLIRPQQSTGSSLSDLYGRHGRKPSATSRAPYPPRAGGEDRPPSVGGAMQTHHGDRPRFQVADTFKETAALETSTLQLRKENEAAKQELQSTRKVLRRAASHPGQSVRTMTSPMSAMSSAGAEPKTKRVYIPVGHWFSSFAKDFADIEAGDHAECERFVSQHPDVFQLDEQEFLREALAALRTERPDYAKRCVQRFTLLEKLREMSFRERQSFFKGLINQDSQIDRDFLLHQRNLMASLRVSLPKVTETESKRKSTLRTHKAITFQKNEEAIQANRDSGEAVEDEAQAMRPDRHHSRHSSLQSNTLSLDSGEAVEDEAQAMRPDRHHSRHSSLQSNTLSLDSGEAVEDEAQVMRPDRHHSRHSSLQIDTLPPDSAALKLPGKTEFRVVVPEANNSGVSKALNIMASSGGVSKTSSELAVTGAIDTARLAGDVAALAVGGYGWYDGHRNNEEAIKLRDQTLKNAEQGLRNRTGIFESRELALDERKRALDEESEKQRKDRIGIGRREDETSALAEQLQKQKLVLDQTELGQIRLAKEFAAEQLKFRNSQVSHEKYGKKLLEDQLETAREKEEVQKAVRVLMEDQEAFEDAEKLAYAVQSDLLMEVNRKMEELASMQREFLQKIAAEKKQLQVKAAAVQKDSEALKKRQRDFEINQAKHESRRNFENETSRTDKKALFMKQRIFDPMYPEKPGLPSAKTTIKHNEHPVHALLAAKSSFLAPPVLKKPAHQLSRSKILPSTVEAMLAAQGSLLSRQERRIHVNSYLVGKQAENCDEKVKASRNNTVITSFESFGSQTALETVITGTSEKATPVRRTSLVVKQKRNSRKLSLR